MLAYGVVIALALGAVPVTLWRAGVGPRARTLPIRYWGVFMRGTTIPRLGYFLREGRLKEGEIIECEGARWRVEFIDDRAPLENAPLVVLRDAADDPL